MRYVALLRAVNLAAKRKVPMAGLRAMMEDLGYTEVQTLLQSGNVAFDAPRTAATELSERIGEALEAEYGFAVPTVIRTAAQLDRVIADNPFPGGEDDGTHLHVAFASGPVRASALADVDTGRFAPEAFRVGKAELYLWYPDGSGRAKMNVPFEKLLGVTMTSRNWNTVKKLRGLAA